jgi:lipopolysaccharide transport protein LptA
MNKILIHIIKKIKTSYLFQWCDITLLFRRSRLLVPWRSRVFIFWCTGALALWCSVMQAADVPKKVTITGDSMELRDKGAVTVFSGGVKLLRDSSMLLGDTMVYHKKTGAAEITGNVMLRFRSESGDTVMAKADNGTYSEQERVGRLWGHPQIVRTSNDEAGQVNVYAREVDFNEATGNMKASGDVHIVQYQTEAWSQEAQFEQQAKHVVLSGDRPVMTRKDSDAWGEYEADAIDIFYADKKVILNGSVRGWLRLAEKTTEQKP